MNGRAPICAADDAASPRAAKPRSREPDAPAAAGHGAAPGRRVRRRGEPVGGADGAGVGLRRGGGHGRTPADSRRIVDGRGRRGPGHRWRWHGVTATSMPDGADARSFPPGMRYPQPASHQAETWTLLARSPSTHWIRTGEDFVTQTSASSMPRSTISTRGFGMAEAAHGSLAAGQGRFAATARTIDGAPGCLGARPAAFAVRLDRARSGLSRRLDVNSMTGLLQRLADDGALAESPPCEKALLCRGSPSGRRCATPCMWPWPPTGSARGLGRRAGLARRDAHGRGVDRSHASAAVDDADSPAGPCSAEEDRLDVLDDAGPPR